MTRPEKIDAIKRFYPEYQKLDPYRDLPGMRKLKAVIRENNLFNVNHEASDGALINMVLEAQGRRKRHLNVARRSQR